MPELPEVVTVCRGLNATLLGREFVRVQNFRDNLRFPLPPGFSNSLENRKIIGISRRAKYILLALDNATTLIMHLGMSGRIVVHNALRNKADKHDHVIFCTNDGKEIVFNDPRRFGMMDIVASAQLNEHKAIKHLGIEPLANEFNGKILYSLLQNRKTPVKLAIMNAQLIVGVGNIYACESLFRAGLKPSREGGKLSLRECTKLADCIKTVLNEAIIAGGSSLRDYVTSSGQTGYFQHNFKVYGRENQACNACGSNITRIVQGGRSTFFCPDCQK